MCSIILIKPQRQKTVVFAAQYHLKRVTIAILNCASFHSLCCLMNRKVKSFKQQWFYQNNKMFSSIKSCNMCSNAVFWHSSLSRMRVINHNWSATKQRPHLQSVAEISCHSVLSGDRIRRCETSSGSRHKETDQCLQVAISFCRHRSVPVPCKNGSAEITAAERGRNLVARLWGHTIGEN